MSICHSKVNRHNFSLNIEQKITPQNDFPNTTLLRSSRNSCQHREKNSREISINKVFLRRKKTDIEVRLMYCNCLQSLASQYRISYCYSIAFFFKNECLCWFFQTFFIRRIKFKFERVYVNKCLYLIIRLFVIDKTWLFYMYNV